MMSKSFILVCAIAAVLGSKLTFKDGSGTCEMVKVGNKITVVDCDLALHNSGYDSVASALDDITGHKNSYHPTEEGINSIRADISTIESYLEYTKVPCTTTGMTASRGVSFSPLANKVTGDEASLSCSANGFKPSSATFSCYSDGFRGTQPTCEPYKCPAETLTWGSASLSFVETENNHVNPTGYSVTKTCPVSHNGAVTRECHENEETWSTSGACSEKTCPAGTFYGISFDSVTQGSTVTKTCPNTHNGQITRTCTANSETWTHTGDCVEKTCAAGTFGGVDFAALTQGQSITNACPASHTGSITRQCNANSETWTHTAGSCVEKTCAATTVNIGGTVLNIDSRTQGESHTVNCPSGYSGTVTGNCPANSNTFSTTHNCLRKCDTLSATGNHNGCNMDTEGAVCTVSCNGGYNGGSTSRTCGSDGSWGGSNPSCTAIPPAASWTRQISWVNTGLIAPGGFYNFGGFHHMGAFNTLEAAAAQCEARMEAHNPKGTEFSVWNVNNCNCAWYCFGGNSPDNGVWGYWLSSWYGQSSYYYRKTGRRLLEGETTGLELENTQQISHMSTEDTQQVMDIVAAVTAAHP